MAKTLYQCEICSRTFDIEEKARECETRHYTAVTVLKNKFNQKLSERYPTEIVVKMSDGQSLTYYRSPR